MATCDYCNWDFDILAGIYDDGDFMCGHCIAEKVGISDEKRGERQHTEGLLSTGKPRD